ncbi:hypothetical protein DEO72_LG10g3266 [Vigna unguiculata]|uniref:Uncharacterized protein n=1 Tax=Vigna unguiculata TaxID=3917 RepID=A0A4D6NJE0_VIGUN|nr:hypothetical protein DEO72_LG10g3266 [Vigna unguiculata]
MLSVDNIFFPNTICFEPFASSRIEHLLHQGLKNVTVSNLKNVGFDKSEKLIARQLLFFFFSQKTYFHSSSVKRQIYMIRRKPFGLKSMGASDGYLVNHNPHDYED